MPYPPAQTDDPPRNADFGDSTEMKTSAVGTDEAIASVAEFLKKRRPTRVIADEMAREIVHAIQRRFVTEQRDKWVEEERKSIAALRRLVIALEKAEAAMEQLSEDDMFLLRIRRRGETPLPEIMLALREWRAAAASRVERQTPDPHAPVSPMRSVYASVIFSWRVRMGPPPGKKEDSPLYLAVRHALKILGLKPRGSSLETYKAAHRAVEAEIVRGSE